MTDYPPMTAATKRLRDLRAEGRGEDDPELQAAFDARMAEVLTGELIAPQPGLWYMSFAGEEGFRGVCIVEAIGVSSAVAKTHALGINPGGEVASVGPIPPDEVAPRWRDRLFTREEVEMTEDDEVRRG